jgi:hypothetical protein
MQDQLTVSSSVLRSCALDNILLVTIIIIGAHVFLIIPSLLPPLPELKQLRVQMLPGQVLAAAAAAAACMCTR